ncbi:MAG: feruloyl-CoA synthase [Burkholderiales bacterium]|nr:feruloyl-CoA synthase [Burkholderiales bacterium]
MSMARYREAHVGGCIEADIQVRADGSTVLRSTEALRWYPERMTDCLEQWAAGTPDRSFVARRDNGGDWRHVSYAQMLQQAQAVGQALLDAGLSRERPLAILSGNDVEHLTLALGAMWAGVPYIPVSTAYSLISKDFGKLRHILSITRPGLVFASGSEYGPAIAATVPADVPVILTAGELEGRSVRHFGELLATRPRAELAEAHAKVDASTVVKLLFTSGSTREPKGVVTTHRMLCSNQQMIRQCLAFLADEPPVLLDWLPWNHVFGGSHNVGIVLYNGGTLYLDDGKPTPAGMAETLRNLREISPTIYFNVPKGLEEIASAMDTDTKLRDTLFARCKAMMYAGAALGQAALDKLYEHAEASVGERVRIITSLGMTETAPSCTYAVGTEVAAGHVGLPNPGVEVKLVHDEESGKTEIRFRGPNVMPGYWQLPEATAAAFDEEGFYRTGDAVRWVDPEDPQRGLLFDGRTAEDFKLASGTFVSVGPLRARIIAAGNPCVQDAVITGLNRNEVGALVIPRPDELRRLVGASADTPLPEVLQSDKARAFFQDMADRLWREATGSASRVARMHVLAEPPSIDKGEVTDKGSINQRAVLTHRAPLVVAMYEGPGSDPHLIQPQGAEAGGT